MELNDAQLLKLDTLIYIMDPRFIEGIFTSDSNGNKALKDGTTVSDIVKAAKEAIINGNFSKDKYNNDISKIDIDFNTNAVIDNLIERNTFDSQKIISVTTEEISLLPCEMTKDEWLSFLGNFEKDSTLLNLKATNFNYVNRESKNENQDLNGFRVCTFVDDLENPTTANSIFMGTNSAEGWIDNADGSTDIETLFQQRSREYIESLPFENIAVSGHSKGGNLAQYVLITTDKIDRCLSFDGQGFSKAFVEKYADEIEKKKHKITAIAAETDYVHCLAIPLIDDEEQIYIDTPPQTNLFHNHKPNIIFDENGNLRGKTSPTSIVAAIRHYTVNLLEQSYPEDNASVRDMFRKTLSFLAVGHVENEALYYRWSEEIKDEYLEKFATTGESILAALEFLKYIDSETKSYFDDILVDYIKVFIEDYVQKWDEAGILEKIEILAETATKATDFIARKIATKALRNCIMASGAAPYVAAIAAGVVIGALICVGIFKAAELLVDYIHTNKRKKYLVNAQTYSQNHSTIFVNDFGYVRMLADMVSDANTTLKALDKKLDSLKLDVLLNLHGIAFIGLCSADTRVREEKRLNCCKKYLLKLADKLEEAERQVSRLFEEGNI